MGGVQGSLHCMACGGGCSADAPACPCPCRPLPLLTPASSSVSSSSIAAHSRVAARGPGSARLMEGVSGCWAASNSTPAGGWQGGGSGGAVGQAGCPSALPAPPPAQLTALRRLHHTSSRPSNRPFTPMPTSALRRLHPHSALPASRDGSHLLQACRCRAHTGMGCLDAGSACPPARGHPQARMRRQHCAHPRPAGGPRCRPPRRR